MRDLGPRTQLNVPRLLKGHVCGKRRTKQQMGSRGSLSSSEDTPPLSYLSQGGGFRLACQTRSHLPWWLAGQLCPGDPEAMSGLSSRERRLISDV